MEKDSWATAFPAAKASPVGISCEEVMKLYDDMDLTGDPKSFLLVDVRIGRYEHSNITSRRLLISKREAQSKDP
jgi:hypothetical protein